MAKKKHRKSRQNPKRVQALAESFSSPKTTEKVYDIDRVVRVNVRLIFSGLVACAVLSVGIHFVHAYQVKHSADALLEHGYKAQRDGNDDEAIRYLSRYIRFRPDDGKQADSHRRQMFTDALVTLGALFEKTSHNPKTWFRVFSTCEEVLRIDPDRDDRDIIRRRIIDAAMKLQRYSDALYHLSELRDHPITPQSTETKGKLAALRAQCHYAMRNYPQALKDYLIAIDNAPSQIDPYRDLISIVARRFDELPGRELLEYLAISRELKELFPRRTVPLNRKPSREQAASPKPNTPSAGDPIPVINGLLRILIAKGKPAYKAYLVQAIYHQSRSKLALAQQDVEQALRQPLDNPEQQAEVYRVAAELALLQAEKSVMAGNQPATERFLETARQYAQSGLKLNPPDVRSYPVLVRVDLQAGRSDDAVRTLHAGLATIDHLRKTIVRTNTADESDTSSSTKSTKPYSGPDRTHPAVLDAVETQLLWTLADVTISQSALAEGTTDTRKIAQARKLIVRLREIGAKKSTVDFLDGHILFLQKQWHRASLNLEAVRPYLAGLSSMVRQLDLFLGICYDQLSNPDRRLDVFRRALGEDPTWIAGRLQLASALTTVNRLDEAVEGYVVLSSRIPHVVAAPLVRLLILQQVQKPKPQRNWQNVFRALAAADQIVPHSAGLAILRSEALAQQQEFGKARRVLQTAIDHTTKTIRETKDRLDAEKSTSAPVKITAGAKLAEEIEQQTTYAVTLHVATANLAVIQKDLPPTVRLKTAESLLATARKTYGDRVELRLATANAARLRPKEQALQTLAELETNRETFSPRQRDRLDRGLARIYVGLGAIDQARRLWQQLAKNHPTSLKPRLMLIELAARDGDEEHLSRTLKSLHNIEGAGGPNGNYAEARRLIRRAGKINSQAMEIIRKATNQKQRDAVKDEITGLRTKRDTLLKQARPLLKQAAAQRPYWTVVSNALANLEFILGNQEVAINHYRKAISLGDRSRQTVSRVVQYLYERKQDAEADRLLKQMAQEKPDLISGDLARLAVAIAWRRRQFDDALGLAGQLASTGSRRVRDLILVSRMRFANGDRDKKNVEQPLRDAVRLALDKQAIQKHPYDVMLAYVALTTYLVRIDQPTVARQVISEAQTRLPKSPRRLRPLTLGRCYEILADNDRAETEYQTAARLEPDDTNLHRELVRFYLRTTNYVRAATEAAKLADAKNQSAALREWANRARALALSGQGGYANGESALKLIRGVQSTPQTASLADLRTEAAILVRRRTNRDRRRLIVVLNEISTRQPLTTAEQFQLARAYAATGNWTKAKPLMEQLLTADSSNRFVMVQYVQGLIRHKQLAQAETWIARLEAAMPNTMPLLALKARLLLARQQTRQAVSLIQNFLKTIKPASSPEKAFRDLVLQNKAAEALTLLQKRAAQQGDTEAIQAVTQARKHLAAGKTEAALTLLKTHLKRSDVRVFLARFNYLAAAKMLDELGHLPAAEQAIRIYLKSSTRPEDILILISNLARQKRTDEALALCSEAWKTCSPAAVANTTVAVIRTGLATPVQIAEVERHLQAAIQKTPESAAGVMIHLADLRDFQSRYDQAEAIYRLLLRQNERNLTAMNNLAWLLAIRHKNLTEAAALIDRAIGIAGPLPELLDTQAVVFLAAGDPAKAVPILESAIDDSPTPLKRFHLAEAHWAMNHRTAATKNWQKSQQSHLSASNFHPLERPHYQALLRKMASP